MIFEISIFGLTIWPSYYGLMYALAFLYWFWIIWKIRKYSNSERESLFLYLFLGVIFWWRIGYTIFYSFNWFVSDPMTLFRVWEGGMSFHWGLIGFILASFLFSKKYKKSFLWLMDDLALIVPVGLFLWRIGNYINKELLWFPYEWFLAVQTAAWSFFPSPLLEAFLEGIIIFVLLNYIHTRKFPGKMWALFLIYYGIFRLFIELFIRTPDIQIWYYFWFITQWSLLSIPMILVGLYLYYFLFKKYVN